MKTKGHLNLATYCKELLPLGASVSVSTLTTLLPFTDVGSENQSIKVILENADPTNTCTLIVDVSHNGTYPNSAMSQQAVAQPLDECSIELHDLMDTFIRIGAAAGAGTVSIKFGIVARER